MAEIQVLAIDDLGCERLDFLKVDVEGMEAEALEGARGAIETFRPIMLVEHIKAPPGALLKLIEGMGYHCIMTPTNILAVHLTDPGLKEVLPQG